jgi:hypothetical protein
MARSPLLTLLCGLWFISLGLGTGTTEVTYVGPSYVGSLGTGWQLALLGAFGLLWLLPGWFANPVILTLWVRLALGKKVGRSSVIWAIVASVLALSSFRLLGQDAAFDGPSEIVTGLGPGFYLWLASVVLTSVVVTVLAAVERRH